MEQMNKKDILRAVKFTVISASAGLIQLGSFTMMNEILVWNYWICYLMALILSVLWNFTINRKITFKSAGNVPVAMLKVALFYAVFAPLSTWGGNELQAAGWNEYIVLALSMIINLVTEFFYQRFIVFGKTIDSAESNN